MPEQTWDFLISFAIEDLKWAERIVAHLRDEGFSVTYFNLEERQRADYPAVRQARRQQCKKVLALMSPAGLESSEEEFWREVCYEDPLGLKRQFIPVKLEPCQPKGFLGPIVAIELGGKSESRALMHLVNLLTGRRSEPRFPG